MENYIIKHKLIEYTMLLDVEGSIWLGVTGDDQTTGCAWEVQCKYLLQ